LLVEEYEILGIDDLTAIGRALPPELPVLAALISGSETAVFLKSNGTPDCHKLVRDNAPAWNGKGGGRPDAARAVFNRREDLKCFIDYLAANYPVCRK
jgi:alanyl-tRNA synthetase